MRTTLGPVVIGCLLSVLLFGFTVMQLISYMQYSFEDPLYIKTIVSTSISQASGGETMHTAVVIHYLYRITVTNFSNPLAILQNEADFCMLILLPAVLNSTALYAYRISFLSRRWVFTILAWIGSVARVITAVIIGVYGIQEGTLDRFLDKYKYLTIVNLGISLAMEIFVTSCLCVFIKADISLFVR
ncbi:hypothetical protein BDV98DRAFT_515814 [Pterulicium gracile]|uniref:Uncharacterized protein n=1 Tax=Pterulicium gracile TaxID=1884261 RepID=A0A5C3Q332_9AGAR|nr:hypothetical protein BDV98DRAFT_515814 [Pterula gracilis]